MINLLDATEMEPDQVEFDRLPWLNIEEAADYLRKTPNALRIMVNRGYIRPAQETQAYALRLQWNDIEFEIPLSKFYKFHQISF